MFKLCFKLILLTVFLIGCSDIARDNPLDPKNPDSISETPILIEAFVNTSFSYDRAALEALDQIQLQFGNNVDLEIVEYHRTHEQGETDIVPFEKEEFRFLQQDYAEMYPDTIGVPDIFVNGSQGRVFGATTSYESVYDRLAPIVSDLAGQPSHYSLEAEISTVGNMLDVNYKIARLGDEPDENLNINIIFVKDYSPVYSSRIVVNYLGGADVVNKIAAGEYYEGKIEDIVCPDLPDYALFTITRQNDITVLKTLKKVIVW